MVRLEDGWGEQMDDVALELLKACREAESTIRCAVAILEIQGSIKRHQNLEVFRLRLHELRSAIAKAESVK
ncbi:hypothetical protein [Desulfosporosinus metallidurans]|uniref:Uncharacterized protein n=1 Tax=Desulfosporosinus metallidurans TaxID=1888891 RepID=A0A1Q8QFB0_9FIRM|nr:hypothetical protein [Desulfosporosinus metallidurans]OLN26037.1 hypothetical protein DSOL_5152 [Desulfosporosinus metallidurans]